MCRPQEEDVRWMSAAGRDRKTVSAWAGFTSLGGPGELDRPTMLQDGGREERK